MKCALLYTAWVFYICKEISKNILTLIIGFFTFCLNFTLIDIVNEGDEKGIERCSRDPFLQTV